MKVPNTRRIQIEDLPEADTWVGRLLAPLNSFFEEVNNGLNSNLTLQENISCQLKELDFSTSATYSAGDFAQLKFNPTLNTRPIGVLILSIIDRSGAPIQGAVSVTWENGQTQILINYISGLADSTDYKVRFLVV